MSTLFYVLLILAPAAILATAYAIIKKRNQGRSQPIVQGGKKTGSKDSKSHEQETQGKNAES